MDFVYKFANYVIDLALIFGPTSGYYFQYRLIRRTKSLGSFSIDICAILIFCNILRIYFWYLKRFETALLYQSIIMIIVQESKIFFLIISLIKEQGINYKTSGVGMSMALIYSLVESIMLVTGIFGTLTYLMADSHLYAELIGCASVMIEACLGIPQLVSNWKNKSTTGLSIGLIAVWFFGDLGKTLFFIIYKQPTQFVMCGFTQLIIDILILFQIYAYGRGYQEIGKKDKHDHFHQQGITVHSNKRLMGETEFETESQTDIDSMSL